MSTRAVAWRDLRVGDRLITGQTVTAKPNDRAAILDGVQAVFMAGDAVVTLIEPDLPMALAAIFTAFPQTTWITEET